MNEKIKQLECSVFADSNIRLDRFLVDLTGKNRSYVSDLISDGYVRINNTIAKRSYKPKQFDLITISFPLNMSKLAPREELISVTDDLIKTSQFIIPIIYHDDHIIVVNKPIGLLVHDAISNESDNLVRILKMASVTLCVGEDGRVGTPVFYVGSRCGLVYLIRQSHRQTLSVGFQDLPRPWCVDENRVHHILQKLFPNHMAYYSKQQTYLVH